ncbi:MAG: ester cyclase, partial [Candidatus Aminicenantes bacterium]|nr:ester cyclase [Candidatus Aminicenantes bacterium]
MKKSMRNGSVLALSGLVLCLCFSIACQDKAAIAELEKYNAQSTVEQQNMALVAKTFGELNKKNAGIYQELYAPDYSWYFPANNLKPLTREEEAGFVKLLWDAFPDIRWEIVEMFAGGERVAVRFAVMGTHTNEYQGLPPTGKAFESGGVWIG